MWLLGEAREATGRSGWGLAWVELRRESGGGDEVWIPGLDRFTVGCINTQVKARLSRCG